MGYPLSMVQAMPLPRESNHKYTYPKLHQLENEVRGLVPKKVHILTTQHHSTAVYHWCGAVLCSNWPVTLHGYLILDSLSFCSPLQMRGLFSRTGPHHTCARTAGYCLAFAWNESVAV